MFFNWSFRIRIALFFALIGLAIPAIVSGAMWAIVQGISEGHDPGGLVFIWGGGAAFVLVALVTGIGVLFDINVAAPIQGLIRDLETVTHANPEHTVDVDAGKHLGGLPSVARDTAETMARTQRNVNALIAEATKASEEQKGRLEAVLRDLHQGVVICNLNHEVLLYNGRALAILHVAGDLGLGRSLFTLVNRQPFFHALERLTNRLTDGRHKTHKDGLAASFVCATRDGRYILQCRMSLILDQAETATGYVITFEDQTEELAALGRRDRLMRAALEETRRPVANLRAAAETLASNPEMNEHFRASFADVIFAESKALGDRLDSLSKEYQEIITGHWPMADVYSANLLNCVVRRLRDKEGIESVITGLPQWLHGDSHTLVELLDRIIHRAWDHVDVSAFDLEVTADTNHMNLDVVWKGEPIPSGTLDSWLDGTLDEGLGGLTARDVLEHHKTQLWSQAVAGGMARIRLPLPLPRDLASVTRPKLPPRPEFYDFGLLQPRASLRALGETSLHDLRYVVFDTETTGLQPSQGDEIISIAGVRIVNGRLLTGESFSELVHPGKAIPKGSTRFHGITDGMIADKPSIEVILPRFHEYVSDAVLVAHNAAFDMKFLGLKEDAAGVHFDNPVLDTLLLSVFVHDHKEQHTLDACAERFGIRIQGRHTALGDSLVTAEIFLRMIELLEARGINTLDDAIQASNEIVEVRARQEEF